MPTTSDINTCLSIQDSIGQLNCMRAAFGYAPVAASSSTSTTCDGLNISGNCISKNMLLIGGIGIVVLFLLVKK